MWSNAFKLHQRLYARRSHEITLAFSMRGLCWALHNQRNAVAAVHNVSCLSVALHAQAAHCAHSHGAPTNSKLGLGPTTTTTITEAQIAVTVDAFSRSRVVQYLKRLPIVATPWIGGPHNVEQLLMAAYDTSVARDTIGAAPVGDTLPSNPLPPACSVISFVSRIVIPIVPSPPANADERGGALPFELWAATVAQEGVDILVATGISTESRAVADSMAAMHAERLLDATGRCLYVVGVAQRRHALQRRQEGHYAPLPGDPIRNLPVNALPLPLLHHNKHDLQPVNEIVSQLPRRPIATGVVKKRLDHVNVRPQQPRPNASPRAAGAGVSTTREEREGGGAGTPHDDETEGMRYMLCNVNTSRLPCAPIIASPALVDPTSVPRVSRALFGGSALAFDAHVNTQAEAAGDAAMIICTFPLGEVLAKMRQSSLRRPLSPECMQISPNLVAKGKASTRERAILLCGMHTELLMYRYQVPMHPDDPPQQQQYERMAENAGWVGFLGVPHAPEPLPLKELHPSKNEYNYRLSRRAPLSNEEKFLRFHGEAFNHCKTFVPIHATRMDFRIPGFDSVGAAEGALELFQRQLHMRALQYIVSGGGEYRTTLLLYNLEHGAQIARVNALRDGSETPACGERHEAPQYLVDDTPLLVANGGRGRHGGGGGGASPAATLLPIAALGVAASMEVSRKLCVLHALEQVNAMNLPLFLFDRARQRAYAEARRLLGLYAPVETQWGVVPTQSRILSQSATNGEITFQEKRELGLGGGCHGASFAVAMAYSPTPSFLQDDRRGCLPPPPNELRTVLHLHTLKEFQPIADDKIQEMANLYHPFIQAHVRDWTAGIGTQQHGSGVRSCAAPLVFQSVVEDQGSGWRHRSSVWLHLIVREGGKQREVVAIGRGTRLVEAERACVVHAAMLLSHYQVQWLPRTRSELLAKHEGLMRSVGRVVEMPPRSQAARPLDSDDGGAAFRICGCLPVVMQSTYDAMRAHARLYGEMRKASAARSDYAAGCGNPPTEH